VNGSRRGNGSVRVSLVAVLVGALLAGGASMASRLDVERGVAYAAVDRTDMLAVTSVVAPVVTTVPVTTPPPPPPTTTTAPPTTTTTTVTKPSPPPPSQIQQVFTLVNQARAQAGCKALVEDPRLDQAAQAHSDDMSARNYFSHTTPEGVTFDKREEAAGYPSPGGENIAQGQTNAQVVMSAWMNSAGHRANILNCSYVAIGIGLATKGWDWTQDFGR
jgi:uncharacterized protein YkwD